MPLRHLYPVLRVVSSDAFLSTLEQELRTATYWRLAENHSEHRAIVAEYIGDAFSGEYLTVAAHDLEYDEPEPVGIISFTTLARRWCRADKEVHVISADDIARAFELFFPVVRGACRRAGIRCRVIYPKPEKTKPLTHGVTQQLESFVRLANAAILHPYDWERFFRFVRYCHAHHVSLGQGRLRTELAARGMRAELADRLALCYAYGRGVLACCSEWVE